MASRLRAGSLLVLATGLVLACGSPEQESTIVAPDLHREREGTLWVSSNLDDGPGSLRDALRVASEDPAVRRIEIGRRLGILRLERGLVMRGSQPLEIRGNGLIIDASGLAATEPAAMLFDGGGDAEFRDLTVRGSPQDGNTGQGIDLDENATGDITATVTQGSASTNGGASIRADQGSAGVGSLRVTRTRLEGNAQGPIVANTGVVVTQVP